ncbi:phosphotransferase family protein [Natrialba sp. SSL1]|uniref:phosphotransferase family protein n=1 Tax=Natrialba sp. SSL1 TaxID=1869245 RepID=UPI0008F910AC|nr:phosphotransferase family protein [Natrialba sp. SSL1]OIB58230.1 hypothetical protein BBD46_07825 [Natrialba sp. SSL1]
MSPSRDELETEALESSLTTELDREVTDSTVIDNGLNLICSVSTATEADAYVVRRPNKLRQTGLFVDLRQEYRILDRLRETPVDAPEPVHYCDDPSIIGGPFVVMTHLDGESIPLGTALPERFQRPAARERVATAVVDALAEIHALETTRFEGVCEYQSPREQVTRALERVRAAESVVGHELPMLRGTGERLQENAPAPSETETTVVHGDFRPSNLLFAGETNPRITGVLDWETAMLGDPHTELGYLLLRWRDEGDPTLSLADLETRASDDALEEISQLNEHGLAPYTANPGSPSREELIDRYEQQTGRTVDHERYYRAHAAFLLATVWADLYRHEVETLAEVATEAETAGDRTASATDADELSEWLPRIEYMTLFARAILDGTFDH